MNEKIKKTYKKPKFKDFKNALEACNGNLSNASKMLGVSRVSIYKWVKEDQNYFDIILNSRKNLLDKCISTAQLVAMGIPDIDKTGRIIGWKEKPDSHMLRYFMSTLGKDEGFGESMEIKHSEIPKQLSSKEAQDFIKQLQNEV